MPVSVTDLREEFLDLSPEKADLCLVIKHPGSNPVSNLFPGSKESLLLSPFQKQWICACILGKSTFPTPVPEIGMCFAFFPSQKQWNFCLIPDDMWLLLLSQLKAFPVTREELGGCMALALHPSISAPLPACLSLRELSPVSSLPSVFLTSIQASEHQRKPLE